MYIVLYRMGFSTYVGYYKPTMIKIRIRMCIENHPHRPDQKLNTPTAPSRFTKTFLD